jgi:hypothetical protein
MIPVLEDKISRRSHTELPQLQNWKVSGIYRGEKRKEEGNDSFLFSLSFCDV